MIEQHGIDFAHGETIPKGEDWPEGNYLYSQHPGYSPGFDTWAVDTEGMEPEWDPANERSTDADPSDYFVRHPIDPSLLRREVPKHMAGAPTKPPNLRQGTPSKNCLACKMYHKNKGGKGKCWGYGEWPVRADQVCDSFAKETRGLLNRFAAHNLQYDRDQHPEGKGFILDDGSVWTWPTENLKPMHMQYNMKAKNQGLRRVPGSAFHIKEGKVWQYGPGRSLSPEQQQAIFAADPKLELAPPRRQEQLDGTPGFSHGQNVLDILERSSS